MEHRWGHRREVSRAVQIGTRGGVVARGRICNVSISGAFVATLLPVRLYAYVTIHISAMVHGKRSATALEAQVVRRSAEGIGVEWCELAPEAIRSLLMVPTFRITRVAAALR